MNVGVWIDNGRREDIKKLRTVTSVNMAIFQKLTVDLVHNPWEEISEESPL